MESVLGQVGDIPSRARRTILRSNGIKTRYYAIDPQSGEPSHNNAELTAEAVRRLADASFDPAEMDCLCCGTSMPDQLMPNHGVMVHGELQTPPTEVIATAGICLAGISSLKYAYLGVASGEYKRAVATGSEVASAIMRGHLFESELEAQLKSLERRPELAFEKDFLRWMLSDGAGAMLLQAEPRPQGLSLRIDWIFMRSYANEMPACMYSGAQKLADARLLGWKYLEPKQWLDESVFAVKQDVKQLNEHIIHYTVERPLTEIQRSKGLQATDIDHFVPHYSSAFFRQKLYDGMVAAGFEIPSERWFTNLERTGNTGSASIYIMLEELFNSGRLSAGQTILCYIPESGRFSSAFMLLTVCDSSA
jgi:3-oxoacyl-[acyl-carrier-protein] synthase-3